MGKLMVGLVLAGCVLGSEAALAECRRPPIRYLLRGNTVAVPLGVLPGTTCMVSWRVGGGAAIESATLISKPRNGQATVSPSTLQYVSKAGAASSDAFGIQICGTNRQGKGCSTLQVTVSP
jgi:hypothetical protein